MAAAWRGRVSIAVDLHARKAGAGRQLGATNNRSKAGPLSEQIKGDPRVAADYAIETTAVTLW